MCTIKHISIYSIYLNKQQNPLSSINKTRLTELEKRSNAVTVGLKQEESKQRPNPGTLNVNQNLR